MADLVTGLGGPSGFGVNYLDRNDDSSTAAIDITSVFPGGFALFGHTYSSIYVNNNGNITFQSPLSEYTPQAIGTGFTSPIVAPFWADVDTNGGPTTPTGGNTTGSNLVWYDVDAASHTVTVTWDDVGYYPGSTDKTDAFQLQLIGGANGAEYIKFIYQHIGWTTGSASGGQDGLGGTPARAGYSAGDGTHYYELPGSGNQAAMLALATTTGDTGAPGVGEFAAGLSGVYNLADPVVSLGGTTPVTSIDFGTVRAGSTATRQITVANGAPTPAENLDVSVAAMGAAVASGSITQLAAGQSDASDLAIGLSPSASGIVTGSVALEFTSDGTATDGLPPTVLPSQTVIVTGTVYQEAEPTAAVSGALVFHVGDRGTGTLRLSDASGYVENLAATVVAATGGVSAPLGALPEIAAGGETDIPLTVSTAQVGVVPGTVTLSYATDGTGTDGASPATVGTQAVTITAAVDAYASLGVSASAGQLTFNGTEYVLNLGTVAQGSTPLSAELVATNTAAGPADLLSGAVSVAAGSGFANSGAGGYAGLAAGQSAGAETVSLATTTAGTFSETLVLHSTGNNASGYSGALSDQTVLVTGTVTPAAPAGRLSADLSLPLTTTAGQTTKGVVTYSNVGNADLTAQILEVSSQSALLGTSAGTVGTGPLLLLGTSTGSSAGTLTPGAAGSIAFSYTPLSAVAGDEVEVSVGTPLAGTAIDWASLKDSLRPPTVDAADWDNVWAGFVARVGTTTDSLTAVLAQDATELAQVGQPTDDVGTLLQYELFQASGALAGTALSAATDIAATGSSLSLSLGRVYGGSLLGRDAAGLFGDGWTSTYDVSAVTDADGDVYVSSPGVLHVFTLQADGSYAAGSGDTATLTLSGGAYRLTQDGTVEQFRTDGKLASVTDGNGNTVALSYDGNGVLQQVQSLATGETITFTSNATGRVTEAADSDGRTVTYSYDSTGTLLLGASGAGGTTSYTYAAATGSAQDNALTSVTDPDGAGARFTYDAAGRLASQAGLDGSDGQTYAYANPGEVTVTDALGHTTTLAYGANGTVAQTTDALGNVTTLGSDASGDLTGLTAADGGAYRYAYDSAGNLTSYTSPLGSTVAASYAPGTSDLTSFTDQLGSQTHYSYDGAGDVTGITYQDGSGDSYTYGTDGLLSSSTDADGNTITYSYDGAGRLTGKSFADGTADTYGYDGHGNLVSATAQDGGTTLYGYDAADRLTSVTDPAGRVESYTYDAAGQLASRTEPDGTVTQYGYDADGRLATLTDRSGNLIDRYSYDATAQLIRTDTGNGASTTYTYDADGNVTSIGNLNPDGSVARSLAYTYDAAGAVTQEVTSDGTWSYGYDASGRLVSADFASTDPAVQDQAFSYAYDAAGNRVSETVNGVTTPYTANALDQYTSVGGTTYTYDADGNLASATDITGTTTYSYNLDNQLVSETGPDGTVKYEYDALGNLVSTSTNGSESEYVNDPLSFEVGGSSLTSVGEVLGSGGAIKEDYVYGLGAAAEDVAGQIVYLDSDAAGNVVATTGPNGSESSMYLYGPYGDVLQANGMGDDGLTFEGDLGVETGPNGLSSIRARFYDPTLGRFLSIDSTGLLGGTNPYEYGADNPITFVDPLGLYKVLGIGTGLYSLYGAVTTGLAGASIIEGALAVGTAFGALPFVATIGVGALVIGVAGLAAYDAGETIGKSLQGSDFEFGYNSIPGALLDVATRFFPVEGAFKALGDNSAKLGSAATELDADKLADKLGDLLFGEEGKETRSSKVTPEAGNGKTATVDGCPHFTTYDGLHFDFQGAGEFIAARSTVAGDTFQLQMRIEPEGSLDSSVSIITQIAIQVGSDRVTFGVPQGDDAPRPHVVMLNGAAVALDQAHPVLALSGGTVTELSSNDYQVVLKTGEIVVVNPFGDGMGYSISLPDSAAPGSVQGFLGPDEGKANVFQLPDGTVLQQPITQTQLYHAFADAWRVTDANSLMDYATGQTTATFTDPMYPREILTLADLPPALVAQAAALAAAAGITDPTIAADAEFDYITMGNPSFFTEDAAVASASTKTPTAATVMAEATPPPSIGVLPVDPQVVESTGDATAVSFTVNLTSAATTDTVVNYAVAPGGGVNGGKTFLTASDFGGTLPAGSVTIAAGRTEAEVTVAVPNSAIATVPDRWLMVDVTSPGGDPVYDPAGQVDILNSQPVAGTPANPALELLATAASVAAGTGATLTQNGTAYTLDLGQVASNTALPALQFALANMTAPPADSLSASFTGMTGDGFTVSGTQPTGTILAGAASANLSVQPDTSTLGTHTVSLTVVPSDVNATGYAGSLSNLTLTVRDTVVAASPAAPGIALMSPRDGSTTPAAIIDTPTPTVTGTTGPGAQVKVLAGGATVGTATADAATGAYTDTLSTGLPLGANTLSASATNTAGTTPGTQTASAYVLPAPVAGVTTTDLASIDIGRLFDAGYAMQFTPGTEAVDLVDGVLSVGPDTDESYVQRLYEGLFGRGGDLSGMSYWIQRLDAGASRLDVAAGFLASPEFVARYGVASAASDQAFVNRLYSGILGRAPTAEDTTFWTGRLGQYGQAAVLDGIADSPEAKADAAVATAQVWAPTVLGTLMQDLYGTGLGREAELAGNAYWQGVLPGLSTAQAAALFVATPEFQALHAGQDPASFVKGLFDAGLGRDPTAAESQPLVAGLQTGTESQADVLVQVAATAGAAANLTRNLNSTSPGANIFQSTDVFAGSSGTPGAYMFRG